MPKTPSPAERRRWQRNLANELGEAAIYRDLAKKRAGEERAILEGLVEAEERHAQHWRALLGDEHSAPVHRSALSRLFSWLSSRFGFFFVLAMTGRTEQRSKYGVDPDATARMAADERIHAEVVSGLASRSRARLSGSFRAAVFGMNDGLLSNLSLVIGVGASGVGRKVILLTGLAGLLAGALSMAAGEYISVTSQREMLEASAPDMSVVKAIADLDADANELALVYRARGLGEQEAARMAASVLSDGVAFEDSLERQEFEELGTGIKAALSSFTFFVCGAIFPIIPYLVGFSGLAALASAVVLVGAVLFFVGGAIGIISGSSPFKKGLRQLALGLAAASITYALGWIFGASGL